MIYLWKNAKDSLFVDAIKDCKIRFKTSSDELKEYCEFHSDITTFGNLEHIFLTSGEIDRLRCKAP